LASKVKLFASEGGIIINTGRRYAIDRVKADTADYHVITHAHYDHLPSRFIGSPLASPETRAFMELRGSLPWRDWLEEVDGVELIDSGHILGSRAVLLEDKIIVTGDVNIKDRLFLQGFKPPRAKILVIEATYGAPRYIFQEFGEIVQGASDYFLTKLREGRRLIALGYSLGKSQILTKLFSWYENLIVSDTVHRYNSLYQAFGIDLLGGYTLYSEAKERGILEDRNWILISPSSGGAVDYIAKRYGALKAYFTGWASDPHHRTEEDYVGFPLSDHADFQGLLEIVRRVAPDKIYVMDGFIQEFTHYLKALGYDAEPLNQGQRRITDF
jgi:putative mRNA 3-end processing factor